MKDEKVPLPTDLKQVRKKIVITAWPVFMELVVSALFGMVDMMMLGNITNEVEAAASVGSVGITNQMVFLGIALIQAFCVGGTALVSRYLGANQREKLQDVVKHVVVLSVCIVGIPLFLATQFFTIPLMKFIGATPDHLQYGPVYFRILGFGVLLQSYKFAITACLRGVQNTKTPMIINLCANFLNVIGNYILIYGKLGLPALGVVGAGISTTFCWFLSASAMTYYVLKKEKKLQVQLKAGFRINPTIIRNMIKIGIPSGLEQMVLRVGIFFFIRIILSLGTIAYATHAIALNIYSLSFTTGQALGIAAAALVGHSLGAKSKELAKHYISETKKMGLIVSIIAASIFLFFGKSIVSLYRNSEQIINMGGKLLSIIALVQPFQTVQLLTTGALRGAGDTIPPLVSAFIGILVVRTLLSRFFVLELGLGLMGAWYALAIEQIIRFIVIETRYRSYKWMDIKLYE
ncbi:MAG: MATE family efflux transporter [Tissierellia bacterium]|nr:MATE family efflux transporter [Tissierellia bacterium]